MEGPSARAPRVAAGLVLLKADAKIKLRAQEAGEKNSRFVDDLSFSGESARDLIRPTARVLAELGFRLNRRKVKVMSQRQLQEITGYSVNSRSAPSVPRYKRDRVRAAIRQLPQLIEEMGEEKALESLTGRINHIRQTNRGSAKRLEDLLRSALAAHSET